MIKTFSKLLLAILILSFCSYLTLGQATKVKAAEYAIYAAVLREIYKENRRDYSNGSHFVFLDNTLTSDDFSSPTQRKFRLLVTTFRKSIRHQGSIERNFPRGEYSKTYHLISQDKLDELFREGQTEYEKQKKAEEKSQKIGEIDFCGSVSWQPFYRNYPEASGYYKLSRVAFSGNLAMVRVRREDVCGGFDLTHILKKTRKGWNLIWSAGSHWVS